MKRFASPGLRQLVRSTGWVKLGLLGLFGLMANVGWAQPANDYFTNAIVLTGYYGTVTGSNVNATLESCEPATVATDDNGSVTVTKSVWYRWTAPATEWVEFDTIGSAFDTVLAVYTTTNGLCSPSLTLVAADDNSGGHSNTNYPYSSQLSFPAVAGTTYYISVNGNAFPATTNSGSLVLDWTYLSRPINDDFTNAIVVTGYSGTTNGSNVNASLEDCEPATVATDDNGSVTVTNSVWYEWTALTAEPVEFDTIGSSFDTVLAVYTTTNGLCDPSLTLVAADDNSGGGNDTNNPYSSQLSFTAVAGTTYYISVNGNAFPATTNAGNLVLNWSSAVPTVSSGTFRFATDPSQPDLYVVSDRDSEGSMGGLYASVEGANITVTRVGGANGRVLVDYQAAALTNTDTFETNYYATNILGMYVGTNGVFYTNVTYLTALSLNTFVYYNGGYQSDTVEGAFTNFLLGAYGPASITNNSTTNRGALVPVPTNAPPLNFSPFTIFVPPQGYNGYNNGITSRQTNFFELPSGFASNSVVHNVTNLVTSTFVTNYYGTNVLVTQTTANGFFSTNFFDEIIIYTNTVYTNNNFGGVTNVGALTNDVVSFTNILFFPGATNGILVGNTLVPVPNNAPPPNFTGSTIYLAPSATNIVTDLATYTNTFITNVYELPTVLATRTASLSGVGSFTPVKGTLAFDDYQMSQSFVVPVAPSQGPGGFADPGLPSLFGVTLSNPRLDTNESSDLEPPTLDPTNDAAEVNVLSSTYPTGPTIFNFERSTFRVTRNEGNAVVYVIPSGGDGTQPVSVSYRIDYPNYNTFPLQAGSDYATPGTDFTSVSGTLNWGAGDFNPQAITIPILNNGAVEFNEDMLLQLYNPQNPNVTPVALGEVSTATLTILFDSDIVTSGGVAPGQQPAGAVDRGWNMEGSSASDPPFLNYPGTSGGVSDGFNGNGGTVYAVAEQPNGEAIVAGGFNSFDGNVYNRIVRLQPDGYQDASFLVSPNSGANDFITSLALQPNGQIIIGGNFTAFNGFNAYHVARLNSDGSLDTTFNSGLGANGTVWALALQTNGQVVIAGQFTSVNGTNLNEVARLNADGSVDASFNPGVGPDGTVNAVVVDTNGRVIIGGDFDTVSGVACGGVARLNTDGSLDTGFAPGIGTYDVVTGSTDPVYALAIQTNGLILVGGAFSDFDLDSYNGIVRLNTDGTVDTTFNPGNGTDNPLTGIADAVYAITLQPDGNILIGGDFTTFNQTRRVGLARLFTDGSVDTSFMDTAYNQFAGVPNHYHNPNAVNTALYAPGNQRNSINAIALESGGNMIIGGSFLQVGGGYTRDDIHPRSNVARLVGNATPGPGNIEFLYNSYSQNENAGNLPVSLSRINGNLGIISAAFFTNTAPPGPGIAPANDFSLNPSPAMPTWPTLWAAAWMRSDGYSGLDYIDIGISNDPSLTENVNANFGLTSPTGTNFFLGGEEIPLGAALGALSTAPLTIIDDNVNPGVLGFSSPSYSVVEGTGTATITITRTNGIGVPVTVVCAASNGTATNGVDYVAATNTVSFTANQTSNTTTFAIKAISTTAPDKTVNLRLFNPTGGATVGLTNAVLTIINNNYAPGHLSFSATNYSASENAGSAVITVNRLGGSVGTMSVTVLTSNGSATNGVNYIGSTNVLTWNNGVAGPTNIVIPVMNDGIVSSNLTVNLQLTNSILNLAATGEPLGFGGTNATLTIVNVNSAGTVEFSSPVYSVKQYAGYALIPVVRTGGSVQTVSVGFATMAGTATNGVNYSSTNGILVFTNGQVSQIIEVPINGNSVNNGLLSLNLVLSNAVPTNALGVPSTAVLNIIDTSSVNEPPGSPDVTYSSFAGMNAAIYAMALQTNNQLLVGGDFTLADGVPRQHVARLNSDGTLDQYFLEPSSAYGANGSVRAIAVQTDGRILVGGLFTNFNSVVLNYVARLNSDGSLDSSFNPGSGADNPVYALAETFVNGQSEVLMGGSFATVDGTSFNGIARLNSAGTPDPNFNVGLGANATVYALAVYPTNSPLAGDVLIGGDFTAVNGANYNHIARLNPDGSLDTTFNPGAGAGDSVRAITIQLDGQILVGGLFTNFNGNTSFNHIARLNPDGSVDTTFNPGLGANDAVFSIALQTDTRIVLGGQFTSCSGVTRNGITRLNPDGTVDPTINFGSGANNFVAAVAVQEDTIAGYPANVPDEKILIGGGFTQYDGQTHNYLARLYGGSISGSGAFEFSSANYQADEDSGSALITINRTGGTSGTNSDGSGVIQVPFYTSDGTATNGINYVGISNNVDFPEGEVTETIAIPLIDDFVITPDLTVNLALSAPTPAGQIGNQPTATLTIINDNSAISFSSATYFIAKNTVNGAATINLVRQGSVNGTSTVIFETTTNGTAVTNVDYLSVSNLVTFAPGVSNVTVTIPVINNNLPEGNGTTVTMLLTNAVGSLLYSPSNAVLTIINTVNSPGLLSFATNNYVVTGGGGGATITVQRTFGSSGPVSASYYTVPGTALPGINYQTTTNFVSFAAGQTNQTISVPLLANGLVQGPVSFSVVLTNATGGAALVAPTNTTVTILNTNYGVAFLNATNYASETNGTAVVFVQRVGGTNSAFSVNYATTDGTARSNVNYIAVNGPLNFAPGQVLESIVVPMLNNHDVTNLMFGLALSGPTAGAQVLSPSNAVVVVQAGYAGLSFTNSAVSVQKNGGSAVITVVCSNTNVEPVSVSYFTSDGTAVAGQDYTAESGTLTFSNGIATNTFAVPVKNNTLLDGNRTFNVSLTNAVAPGMLVVPSNQVVTIIDDNSAVSFSSAAYTVLKTGVAATITVLRTDNTNITTTVNFTTANGTAVAGTNYVATSGTLIFTNGVTSQTFPVTIIDTTAVQPDKTVLLQLSSPTNGILVPPMAATLTIHDTSGSLVVPDGSILISPANGNGIINPGENVTLLFAFRAEAGTNIANFSATLLATNGVTSPSPIGSMTPGSLTVGGPPASQEFSFTASNTGIYTNGQQIAATFQLTNGASGIGTAIFTYTLGTWTNTFYSTNAIIINDDTTASPYPSVINVSGVGGVLVKATTTLTNITHASPADIEVLLVSPGAQDTFIMANAGGQNPINNVTLKFDDAATNSLPPTMYPQTSITNGTYKPTAYLPVPAFP